MPKKSKFDECVRPNFDLIRGMKSNGSTGAEIAKAIGVSYSMFKRYLNENEELKEIYGFSTITLIEKLKQTLYDKALGKCQESKTVINQKLKDGKVIEEKKHIEKRTLPPDLGAIIFALCNLDPKNWRRVDKEEAQENIKIILGDSVANKFVEDLKRMPQIDKPKGIEEQEDES